MNSTDIFPRLFVRDADAHTRVGQFAYDHPFLTMFFFLAAPILIFSHLLLDDPFAFLNGTLRAHQGVADASVEVTAILWAAYFINRWDAVARHNARLRREEKLTAEELIAQIQENRNVH